VARKIVTLNVSYLSCPRRRMCACIVRRAQQTQNETADTTADGKTTHRTKSLGCTAIPRTSPNRLVAPLTRLRAQALLASPLATIWCRSLNCELACRGGIGEGPLWLLRICNHVLVLDPEELVLRSARDTLHGAFGCPPTKPWLQPRVCDPVACSWSPQVAVVSVTWATCKDHYPAVRRCAGSRLNLAPSRTCVIPTL